MAAFGQALPDPINKLKDSDSSARQNAAKTIVVMGDEIAVDFLIAVLKDDNRFVRQEAIWALGKIRCKSIRSSHLSLS